MNLFFCFQEAERLINAHRSSFSEIVRHCLNHAVEGDTKRRAGLATLLAKFIRKNAFPLTSVVARYCASTQCGYAFVVWSMCRLI